MPESFITHLECSYCGETFDAGEPMRTCSSCEKVLFARYDLEKASGAKAELQSRDPNMWRYREVMPVKDEANIITLGEGMTPIIDAQRLAHEVGSPALLLKDEGVCPTGSFKARGLSAAVSKAKELGLMKLTMPSAGNAAGAMSAYAAAGGLEANVFMPKDAPSANQVECLAYGANLTLVDGFINDAGRISGEAAAERGLFDVSTLKEPYRAEGKKTMGYEIAEQLGWELPDVIVYPTGGGTGIVGMWKAFDEMERMGWIGSKRPRMVVVQAEGCAPLVTAYEAGERHADLFPNPHTIAAGIRVPVAIGDYLVLDAVRESGGTALTVTDDEMVRGVKDLSSYEGMFAAPEGGALVAALRKMLSDGTVSKDERVLLLITGSGLKYLDVLTPALAALQ
ncbi:MAG: threonine synthase [Chloroflexi bacterium]|nr:threonine synthase [Chloroflexota bacterium]MBT4515564.1 threonine synthase [Chloroflexota bacterium]MBT6681195.1 threonine synthase [Chloroflexota bacterium]